MARPPFIAPAANVETCPRDGLSKLSFSLQNSRRLARSSARAGFSDRSAHFEALAELGKVSVRIYVESPEVQPGWTGPPRRKSWAQFFHFGPFSLRRRCSFLNRCLRAFHLAHLDSTEHRCQFCRDFISKFHEIFQSRRFEKSRDNEPAGLSSAIRVHTAYTYTSCQIIQ